jgi:S1-C subfamily serine protease
LAILVAALVLVGVTAGAIVYGPDIVNPFPPEDSMLARAQQSVVTINVIGDHFKGSGSGFFIDESGHVLTNAHVVKNAWKVTVTTRGGAIQVARLATVDNVNDLAVLVVPIPGPKLTLRPDPAKVGEQVYVLGNPGGSSPNSTSKGTVSKVHVAHTVDGTTYTNLATTDALVRPGNSGGPVIDRRGVVLGVLSVGSEITGAGEFILDSTFGTALRNWSRLSTADAFAAPAPDILVTASKFEGSCNPGCAMRATVTNVGGPGVAVVTFIVSESNKATVLAKCAKRVALNKGDTATTRCVVTSAALTNYFYGYSYRSVWGWAIISSESAVPV